MLFLDLGGPTGFSQHSYTWSHSQQLYQDAQTSVAIAGQGDKDGLPSKSPRPSVHLQHHITARRHGSLQERASTVATEHKALKTEAYHAFAVHNGWHLVNLLHHQVSSVDVPLCLDGYAMEMMHHQGLSQGNGYMCICHGFQH